MNNTTLEIKRTLDGSVAPETNVIFDTQSLYPAGIGYDSATGVITFNEIGQYSIKWWVATETTLKGAIGFALTSSQGDLILGSSPLKTGQVSGFGAIDVTTAGATLSLVNKSVTNTVFSRKSLAKAYLLITQIETEKSTNIRVYRNDLSTPGSFIEAPLGNGIYYRVEYLNSTQLRLVLVPMNGPTRYDYRRLSSFDGGVLFEGDYSDNTTISASVIKDTLIYNNSREMHRVWIRVQNPTSTLWSTYEVNLFASNGISRVTVWVTVVEEEVSY